MIMGESIGVHYTDGRTVSMDISLSEIRVVLFLLFSSLSIIKCEVLVITHFWTDARFRNQNRAPARVVHASRFSHYHRCFHMSSPINAHSF